MAPANRSDTAHDLTETFTNRVGSSAPNLRHTFQSHLLNLYASQHAEKWVEFVSEHLQSYTLSPKPQLTVHGNPTPFKRLKEKSFSGDVSGTIAEMLFSGLLREYYDIPIQRIVHLRSVKRNGPYPGESPDFYVFNPPGRLVRNFRLAATTKTKKVAAEVKGSTSGTRGIKYKLQKALQQVAAAFILDKPRGGIVCVAIRNPRQNSLYDLLLVGVKR